MIRVAMLSRWHVHADDYAKQIMKNDEAEIVAVWDEDSKRGKRWADEIGVDFEPDLEKLLSRTDIDAVVVNTPTSMHREVIVSAANKGKHIFTEKVMAPTVKECMEIKDAVENGKVKFCISFPQRTFPANLFAKRVVSEKLIGDITLLRIRNAHNGAIANWLPDYFYNAALCGGGAMMDLGAHPMYLSRWLLGEPVSISSVFNSFTEKPVEDNAVSVIEFKNKAIGIVETGFVSTNSMPWLEIYGTQGVLIIGGPEDRVYISSTREDVGTRWVDKDELPKALPMPIEQWIAAITKGEHIEFGLDEGMELTQLMEGAYASFNEGRKISFSSLLR